VDVGDVVWPVTRAERGRAGTDGSAWSESTGRCGLAGVEVGYPVGNGGLSPVVRTGSSFVLQPRVGAGPRGRECAVAACLSHAMGGCGASQRWTVGASGRRSGEVCGLTVSEL
jgi:hypothetical protein